MIDITELEFFTIMEISNLLRDHHNQSIKIYVPKSSKLFFSEREDISYDYIRAAYAGQKLFDVSNFFEYEMVSPEIHKSIEFEVICTDIEVLANTIKELTYLYGINDNPDLDELDQLENIARFAEDIDKMQIVPACPYFISIWKRFNCEERGRED